MLSFIIALISISILIWQVRIDRNLDLFSPIILFQIYFFVQLPLNLFFGHNFNFPRFQAISLHSSNTDILNLGFYILLSQSIILAVYYLVRFKWSGFRNIANDWPTSYVNYCCIGFFAIGYISFAYLIYLNGGYTAFVDQREVWRAQGSVGQGWILFPATTVISTAACAVMLNNKEKFSGYSGFIRLCLIYVFTVLPASQLGFRSFVLLPLIQIVFFYHFYVRRINIILATSVGLFFALVFTLSGMEREIPYKIADGSYLEYMQNMYYKRPDVVFSIFLRSMGADISQQTMDYVNMFGDFKLLYPSFIEAITIPIPQALWSDKPTPLSVQFSLQVMGISGGVSPTVVGEGYWHGGILGILGLGAILGMLFRIFENLKAQSKTNMGAALLMLTIYPSLIMMSEAFQGYFNALVLFIILNFLVRRLFAFGELSR